MEGGMLGQKENAKCQWMGSGGAWWRNGWCTDPRHRGLQSHVSNMLYTHRFHEPLTNSKQRNSRGEWRLCRNVFTVYFHESGQVSWRSWHANKLQVNPLAQRLERKINTQECTNKEQSKKRQDVYNGIWDYMIESMRLYIRLWQNFGDYILLRPGPFSYLLYSGHFVVGTFNVVHACSYGL